MPSPFLYAYNILYEIHLADPIQKQASKQNASKQASRQAGAQGAQASEQAGKQKAGKQKAGEQKAGKQKAGKQKAGIAMRCIAGRLAIRPALEGKKRRPSVLIFGCRGLLGVASASPFSGFGPLECASRNTENENSKIEKLNHLCHSCALDRSSCLCLVHCCTLDRSSCLEGPCLHRF